MRCGRSRDATDDAHAAEGRAACRQGVLHRGGTAIAIVTGISTVFLYAAHGLPIWLALRSDEWRTARVWSLGRFSRPAAVLSVIWVEFLVVLFWHPTSGNIAWPFMAVAMVFVVVYSFGWARAHFAGPVVQGAEAGLTEIELEFRHASAEPQGGTAG